MDFKLNLPELCPPAKTESANLQAVYRLINGTQIDEKDLISHVEAGLGFPKAKLCQAHAISFYKDFESCKKAKNKFKNLRKKSIYEGKITKECGVVDLFLNNNHINLWAYRDVDLLSIFKGE
ncbi:hypothetical protein [Mammaliicoccus sciuri]|uniref:hypothetical protein n=1 Tax=Mammaliicoccus sciuri TaxID=1296 RepID=UPI002DB6DC8D|nr:hypothetical protein [Mammaliicoccus sciuri]MEB5758264.1 hypothetical protein [Mammaliicoccus sciuri]